jgi:integrase/recombinase XerD
VHGKGGDDRRVPIFPMLYVRLRRFAERGRPRSGATERIFVTQRRSRITGDYEPLVGRAVQVVMATLTIKAGIDSKKPTHPHALRHAYATWMLRQNMNPLQLQRILGHRDLTMISTVYSHLTPHDTFDAAMAALRAENGGGK